MRVVPQNGPRQFEPPLSSPTFGAKPILVYVDHTSRFERNTGIQRCVRSLSSAWLSLGARLQPVTWNHERKKLIPASHLARQKLARWGGPSPAAWLEDQVLVESDWLFVIELVSGPYNPTEEELRQESHRLRLRLAWLFHDAIPVRFAHLYGSQATQVVRSHVAYMNGLANFDVVLANSQATASHLREHWHQEKINPRARLCTLPLATEFPAHERCPAPSGEESLVLCVGSLEPRKNHQGLLKALISLVAATVGRVLQIASRLANDARVV